MTDYSKIILHLDMNSYFASVEQQANPHLRGKPVGVCEHLGGIIIAPSVEAKRLGIKLGTTVWDARKIYPKIVLLPVDPDKYRHVTAGFLRILMDYTDEVERASIDEAFADLTGVASDYDDALLLGLEIKQRLRQEVGEWVSCSIGIGPNKLIAKIAADLAPFEIRPAAGTAAAASGRLISNGVKAKGVIFDNLCVITPQDISMLYNRLKLTDIPGIATRTELALNKLGIFTLRQLASYPLGNLLNQFGLWGYTLHGMANFKDAGFFAIPAGEQIKSIGHSYTLPKVIDNSADIKRLMLKLSEKVGRRMRRKNAQGNIIHYFHSGPSPLIPLPQGGRGEGEGGFSKQHKINELINDGKDIYQAAWRIFRDLQAGRISNGVKIMGISVSGLQFANPDPFLFPQYEKPKLLVGAMDKINDKYGEFTIRRGRLLGIDDEWGKDTVGFGRMKEFKING